MSCWDGRFGRPAERSEAASRYRQIAICATFVIPNRVPSPVRNLLLESRAWLASSSSRILTTVNLTVIP